MKYLLPSLFLLLFLIPNSNFAQGDWIKYKAPEGLMFTIDVPGEMEKTSKTIETAVGELTTITYAFQSTEEDPNYLYLINLVQYPEETFPNDSLALINDYLDNSLLTSAENVFGELIYSSDLDNGIGKLFRIKYNDGNAIIKGKSYIRKDVFISLQVFTTKDKSLNSEMDYFLDSFRPKF